MDLRRIISAIDFGPDTDKVLAYTEWLADLQCGKVAITLLHVMDYTLTPPAYLLPYVKEEEGKNQVRLEFLSNGLKAKKINVECAIATGHLVEAFRRYVDEKNADILVMGFRVHLIRLSSSERLMRSLQQPLLVIRGEKAAAAVAGQVRIKRILCPVDFSANSTKAFEWARSLARQSKAELTLLHILIDPFLQLSQHKGFNIASREKFLGETMAEAEEKISELVRGSDRFQTLVRCGDPCTAISEIVRDLDIDLIVMGAKGSHVFSNLLLGSTTESVLRSSSCPVLIVH